LLRQSEYIEEITTYAISYDGMVGNRLRQLRDLLAPPRPSNSRIIRMTIYDEHEPFQTVDYTKVKRGVLADFARIAQRVATKEDLQIPNRGLTLLLDRDQLKDKPEWQQVHTKWLMDLMMRATVLEAIALLEASATVSNTTWDAGSNPDLELKNDIIALANATGFYPSTAIYGDIAALKRQNAYESQLTAGALARAGQFTEEQVATAIGVERCIINAERYQQATGATKQEIIGSNVLLFTSIEADGPMDSSNLVRHVADAAYGGGDYAVYVTDVGVKLIALTVENYEYLHVQHTTGIQQVAVN
jgi:lambda repressor-like predicted transcriptional regulator